MIKDDLEYKRKSRFGIVQRYKKSKIKHKDDKELLKTLHGIPIEEWGPDEVGLWLESLNLSEYKAAFLRHDIRGTEIRNLERRDLRVFFKGFFSCFFFNFNKKIINLRSLE